MLHHVPIPAAQSHPYLDAFSAQFLSREESTGSGERLSFKGTLASSGELRFGRTSSAETRTSDLGPEGVFRFVSRPLLGVTLRGYPAPCGSALFCFDLRRPAGYGFHLRWTLRKCRAWHLGAGPSRSASPGVTRAGFGNFNKTEITTMYQNKVTLIGFIGNDAEVRTNDNRSFTTLSLATKSSYKKDGQYISHTEWHRCVIFGKLSEFAGTLRKGTHLQVEGELRSREYETKKVGKKPALKKTIWEIRVNSILKLDRAEKASPEEQETESQLPLEAAA